MIRDSFLASILTSLKKRVVRTEVLVKKGLNPNPSKDGRVIRDYENHLIKFTPEARSIKVYYDMDNKTNLRAVFAVWMDYLKEGRGLLAEPLQQLDEYVEGWKAGKIVTVEDLNSIRRLIRQCSDVYRPMYEEAAKRAKVYMESNQEDVYVDSVFIRLFEPRTDVYYAKVHKRLFGKAYINQDILRAQISRDDRITLRVKTILKDLEETYNYVGKGQEFEDWRNIAHQFFAIISSYLDLIDADIRFLICMHDVSEQVFNFKIYPNRTIMDEP